MYVYAVSYISQKGNLNMQKKQKNKLYLKGQI